MSTSEPDPTEARQWLGHLARLRRRTRLQRQGYWFPLIIFGAALLAAAPLYTVTFRVSPDPRSPAGALRYLQAMGRMPQQDHLVPSASGAEAGHVSSAACLISGPSHTARPGGPCAMTPARFGRSRTIAPTPDFQVQFKQPSPLRAALFWLVAGAAGYLAIGAFYRRRARRRGVTTSTGAYLCTGVGLLIAVVAATAAGVFPLDELVLRQMVPLVTIGAGLLVLARAERSWLLATTGLVFLAALLFSSHFARPAADRGLPFAAAAVLAPWQIALPGVLLLAAGAATALSRRVRARSA